MLITTATELPRLMSCIGSRLMDRAVPDDADTDACDEGNAADWLAEQMFAGNTVPVGSKAPNGWVITDDMVDHISEYVGALEPGGAMQVVTTWGMDGSFEVRGRGDHIAYAANSNRVEYVNGGNGNVLEHPNSMLTVTDLKYGHRIVSPERNWTLLSHAIGFCILNQVQPDHVVLKIHQPRPYHTDGPIREWDVPNGYTGLLELYQAVCATLSNPTNELVSGPHCNKCHARFDCPALDRAAWSAVEHTTTAFNDTMPNNALAFELDQMEHAADTLKIKIDAIQELMAHRIKSGQVINGYAMQARQGNRRFKSGLTAHALSAVTGVDLTTDKLPTPAEAERRGVSRQVLDALTERPSLGQKLSKIDADAVARRAFGDRS